MASGKKGFGIGVINLKKQPVRQSEELKRKQDEAETAAVYKDFLESFEEAPKASTQRSWIKGGVVQAGASDAETNARQAARESSYVYKPTQKFGKSLGEENPDDTPFKKLPAPATPSDTAKPKLIKKEEKKKVSNLELFKEELKVIQIERETRRQQRGSRKAHDSAEQLVVEEDGSSVPKRFRDSSPTSSAVAASDYDEMPFNYENDKSTTNLFLGNLNPKINEAQLCEIFGVFGPLASVKIMWPRTDEERARNRNCGFVAYVNRRDGERALSLLRGKTVLEYEMKMGWGKAVPIPPHPVYIPQALVEAALPPPITNLPFCAAPRNAPRDKVHFTMPHDPRDAQDFLRGTVVRVVIPQDRQLLCLIHRLIEFVIREGPVFEAMIMQREMTNPQYRFLFDNNAAAHIYYRWKLFSILQGDSPSKWRSNEFRMFKHGSLWRPPATNAFSGGMSDELIAKEFRRVMTTYGDKKDRDKLEREIDAFLASAHGRDRQRSRSRSASSASSDEHEALSSSRRSERERERLLVKESRKPLTEAQRDRLEDTLRELAPQRLTVGEVMSWCVEHAECAEEICECLCESLSLAETPLEKKLARLYLVNDILFNAGSNVAHASFFRRYFSSRLVSLFEHFREYVTSNRLRTEPFQTAVRRCLRAWEGWNLYPSEQLILLQNTFLGLKPKIADSQEADAIPESAVPAIKSLVPDYDGIPIDDKANDPDSDVDGTPIESDALIASGVSVFQGIFDDINEPPLPDRIEGADFETAKRKPAFGESKRRPDDAETSAQASGSGFVHSKWEEVDPLTVQQQAITLSKWELMELEKDSKTPDAEAAIDGEPISLPTNTPVATPLKTTATPKPKETPANKTGQASTSNEKMSDEKRARLREIEVKVAKLREELETGKRLREGDASIDDQCELYRKKLLEKEQSRDLLSLLESVKKEKQKASSTATGTDKQKDKSVKDKDKEKDKDREKDKSKEKDKDKDKDKDKKERRKSRSRSRSRGRTARSRRSRSKSRTRAHSRSRSPNTKHTTASSSKPTGTNSSSSSRKRSASPSRDSKSDKSKQSRR